MAMKVLKYKKDGNTLTDKHMELTPLNDSVFIREWEEDYYGIKKYVDIVFLFGNTYFWADTMFESTYNNNIETIKGINKEFILNWINSGFPNNLKIEVLKREGIDYQYLIDKREAILKERQQKEEEKKAQREADYREAELKRKQKLNECAELFVKGERIDRDMFLELCKLNNIDIHIRTVGMLNKLSRCAIGFDSSDISGNAKKIKTMNFDRVFEAARELKTALINQ